MSDFLSTRRRAAPALLLGALLASLPCGCKSSSAEIPDEPAERSLLETARSALAEGDVDAAIDASEELLEVTKDGARRQEALYLAGEARFADDAPFKAFHHYQSLLHDFPWSQWVPKIEPHVWQIGADYLARSPWFLFGDLFSGRERGAEVMREYASSFPSSPRADDALAMVAQYRWSRREYPEAITYYARVARNYPDSEWADLAAYRRAEGFLLEARGAAYDPTPLLKAARNFRRYLSERPGGERREAAAAAAAQVDSAIAQGELLRAQFYVAREQEQGARMHYANVVLAYPATPAAEVARAELAKKGWDLSIHSLDTLKAPPQEVDE